MTMTKRGVKSKTINIKTINYPSVENLWDTAEFILADDVPYVVCKYEQAAFPTFYTLSDFLKSNNLVEEIFEAFFNDDIYYVLLPKKSEVVMNYYE